MTGLPVIFERVVTQKNLQAQAESSDT